MTYIVRKPAASASTSPSERASRDASYRRRVEAHIIREIGICPPLREHQLYTARHNDLPAEEFAREIIAQTDW